MSSKWSWVFGILTAVGFLFAFLFFLPTQNVTDRDCWAAAIGAGLGALLSALIATFVFHGSKHKENQAVSSAAAKADADALLARNTRLTELMALIPSRKDRLRNLGDEKNELELRIIEAQGEAASNFAKAHEAANNRMRDIALELESNSKQWLRSETQHKTRLGAVEAEIARLELLTDDAWKHEQATMRLLGSEDILRPLIEGH